MAISISTAVQLDKRTVTLLDLRDVEREFLGPAISEEMQVTALDENLVQMRAGNDPSRVVLDGRTSIDLEGRDTNVLTRAAQRDALVFPIHEAKRRITFYYTDISVLKDATKYAWLALRKLMRKQKGQAWRSMYIWISEPGKGGEKHEFLSTALKRLDNATHPLTNVNILGPLTEYRRYVIYSHNGPGGKSQQATKQTSLSSAYKRKGKYGVHRYQLLRRGTKLPGGYKAQGKGVVATRWRAGTDRYGGGGRALLAKAVQELVKQRVKRQFKDIWVGYRFTRSREVLRLYNSPKWRPDGENIHVPVLFLGVKAPGRHSRTVTRNR